MKVAVLRETLPNESRVGLVPDGVKFLKKKEIEVVVEKDAGLTAGFLDSAYEAQGATIAPDAAAAVAGADFVLKIQPPTVEEVPTLAKGQVLMSSLQPVMALDIVKALRDQGVTTMAMDLMPTNWNHTALVALLPSWAFGLPRDELLALLGNSEGRGKLKVNPLPIWLLAVEERWDKIRLLSSRSQVEQIPDRTFCASMGSGFQHLTE